MFIDYFKNLSAELNSRIESLALKPNAVIISQDAGSNYLYLVMKGSVKVYRINERGQEFLIGLFGSGEFFGELEFFTHTNYFCSVETITECTLLRFTKSVFENILREKPEIYRDFCSMLAARLLKISERSAESSYYPLEVLLAKFFINEMKDSNSPDFKISKENLAGYFGTNGRSINRIIKKFVDAGWIVASGNNVSINQPDKLEKVFKQY